MTRWKVYYIVRALLSALVPGAIGALSVWGASYATEIFDVLLIAMGLAAILLTLSPLVVSVRGIANRKKRGYATLSLALVQISLGIAFLFLERDTLATGILLLLYAVILPVLFLVFSNDRRRACRTQLPQTLLGLFLLLVSLANTERTMCLIFGVTVIAISLCYLVISFVRIHKQPRT